MKMLWIILPLAILISCAEKTVQPVNAKSDEELRDEYFEKLVEKGDQLLNAQLYAEAKAAYYDALSLKPDESYVYERVQKCEWLENRGSKCLMKLQEAEHYFDAKEYSKALEKYAYCKLNCSGYVDTSYVKNKIEEITVILEQ